MTPLEGGVANGRGLKMSFYDSPLSLSTAEVRPDVVHHLLKCGRAFCANGVGFHILVEHFIVGWQDDEADFRSVFVDPLLRFFGIRYNIPEMPTEPTRGTMQEGGPCRR